jgi:GH35 family endo-1,4-beta-xylanase
MQQTYNDRFAALFNYATLPFYWGGYERSKGVTDEARVERMAEWCVKNNIATKGHPLVWHEVFPQWGNDIPDEELISLLEKRVREIVSHFEGKVQLWDVVNEATVSHRFDNAVGRWMAKNGAAACVREAFRWANEANPSAELCYNDFNVSESFEELVSSLCDQDAPISMVGIQSHMHKGTWPLERAWQVCETYSRFDLPIHWTELTVLSGRPKTDNDWHARQTDWDSTPEGEEAQAEYAIKLYTLLFSHPAVEAITWWDFADYSAWQGAPAGFLRKDMSTKPLYDSLLDIVKNRWTTDVNTRTTKDGVVLARCFFGKHDVKVKSGSGETLEGNFSLRRLGERKLRVKVTA